MYLNRQKQKQNDKIKFWKSVPSISLTTPKASKVRFITSKNDLFYRKQLAYTMEHGNIPMLLA